MRWEISFAPIFCSFRIIYGHLSLAPAPRISLSLFSYYSLQLTLLFISLLCYFSFCSSCSQTAAHLAKVIGYIDTQFQIVIRGTPKARRIKIRKIIEIHIYAICLQAPCVYQSFRLKCIAAKATIYDTTTVFNFSVYKRTHQIDNNVITPR